MDFHEILHILGQNTPKLIWKLQKNKNIYYSFHNCSQSLLLQDITALNTKKGTTPKSVFSIAKLLQNLLSGVMGKVLTDLNVGSSELVKPNNL